MARRFSGFTSIGHSHPVVSMNPPPSPTSSMSLLQYSSTSSGLPRESRAAGTSPLMHMCPLRISLALKMSVVPSRSQTHLPFGSFFR